MSKIPVVATEEAFGKVLHLLDQGASDAKLEVGIFTCDAGKALEKHDHGIRSEWCFLLKGDAIFEIENEKTLVKEGEMIKLPANLKHLSYPATEGSDFTSIFIISKDIGSQEKHEN